MKIKTKIQKVFFTIVKKNRIKISIIQPSLIKTILLRPFNKIISLAFLLDKTERMNELIPHVAGRLQNKNWRRLS